MEDQQEVLANFMAITGASTEQAMQCLEAGNFEMDDAVNFFFAAFEGGGAAPTRVAAAKLGAQGGTKPCRGWRRMGRMGVTSAPMLCGGQTPPTKLPHAHPVTSATTAGRGGGGDAGGSGAGGPGDAPFIPPDDMDAHGGGDSVRAPLPSKVRRLQGFRVGALGPGPEALSPLGSSCDRGPGRQRARPAVLHSARLQGWSPRAWAGP
jgi:hypothetical protein